MILTTKIFVWIYSKGRAVFIGNLDISCDHIYHYQFYGGLCVLETITRYREGGGNIMGWRQWYHIYLPPLVPLIPVTWPDLARPLSQGGTSGVILGHVGTLWGGRGGAHYNYTKHRRDHLKINIIQHVSPILTEFTATRETLCILHKLHFIRRRK